MIDALTRQRCERLLAHTIDICARYGFPLSMIRIWGGQTGFHYDGSQWKESSYSDWPNWIFEFSQEAEMYAAEVHKECHGYWPFAILWFGDRDVGQETVGLAVPWVTMGYLHNDEFRRWWL